MSGPAPQLLLRPALRVFLLVCAAGLAWAVCTGEVWEDFYITFRISKNLTAGHGLTYTPGERVHAFTSPLGVLLPAAANLIGGGRSDAAALWIFRLMGLAALGGAGVLLWRMMRALFPEAGLAGLLVAAVALESKTLGFTVNGMETGLLLLFLAWAFWALFTRPRRSGWHLGLAWGGMMWSRPDACVPIAAMAAGVMLLAPAAGGYLASRRAWLREIALAAAVGAVVYLPWFVWAWSYYGSPVPHTITAKGLFTDASAGHLAGELLRFPFAVLGGNSSVGLTFLPYYAGRTAWAGWLPQLSFAVAVIPLGLFLLPFVRWEARVASFVYAAGHFYLTALAHPMPWYLPPVMLPGVVALFLVLGQLKAELARSAGRESSPQAVRRLQRALTALAAAFVLVLAGLTVVMARQACLQMRLIERPVRQAAGLWLRDHARDAHATVFLEPLGYIGYYSGLKMFDYPGLASPEVVAVRRRNPARTFPGNWLEIIHALRPDWLVLRPAEADGLARQDRRLLRDDYELVKTFDATAEVAGARWLPAPALLEFDMVFRIYRRREVARPVEAAGTASRKFCVILESN